MVYLLEDARPDEVMEGIRAVRRDESPLPPKTARRLLGARTGDTGVEATPREREVLELLRDGLPTVGVDRRLGISERTAKVYGCARHAS